MRSGNLTRPESGRRISPYRDRRAGCFDRLTLSVQSASRVDRLSTRHGSGRRWLQKWATGLFIRCRSMPSSGWFGPYSSSRHDGRRVLDFNTICVLQCGHFSRSSGGDSRTDGDRSGRSTAVGGGRGCERWHCCWRQTVFRRIRVKN